MAGKPQADPHCRSGYPDRARCAAEQKQRAYHVAAAPAAKFSQNHPICPLARKNSSLPKYGITAEQHHLCTG